MQFQLTFKFTYYLLHYKTFYFIYSDNFSIKIQGNNRSVVSLDFNAEIITVNKIKCLVVK